ncbi:MAG: DUF2061 domain-containing protein [Bacteroidales bacterium]
MLDVLISNTGNKPEEKQEFTLSERIDKPVKSFLKAVSWRIVGTIDTMMISYIVTGKLTVAFTIGSVEVITKTILYYFHERLWAHIHRIRFKGLTKTYDKQYRTDKIKQPA